MNNGSGYDLIIFTARKEEQYFLKTLFDPRDDAHYKGVQNVQPTSEWDNLRIGLVNLGEMGNVASAIKAFEVLERVLPRSVVMVGLAGGYNPAEGSPTLRRGDVGVAHQIFYHSYGKVKRKGRREIRDKLEVTLPEELVKWMKDERFSDAAFRKGVQDRVKEWWSDANACCERKWLEAVPNDRDRKGYKGQEPPTADIKVDTVNVSSGEEVIADAGRIQEIRDAHSVKDISLFEMESYGIGRVCHEFDIPFFLIKGISDYADAPPPWYRLDQRLFKSRRGKNDQSRWRAIAAASAVALELLKSGFRSKVVEPSKPARPGADNLVGCLHPDGRVLCRYQDSEIRKADIRKCVHPGPMLKDCTAAWLCRTFEDITATGFSDQLEESIRKLVGEENAVITTFFPYSARDLLLLFRRMGGNANDLAIVEDDSKSVADRVAALAHLILAIRPKLTHFLAFDAVCKERAIRAEQFGRGQPQIARIVILDESGPHTVEEILADPCSAAFPLLLGQHVPTYFVLAGRLIKDAKACTPDVTFIDHRLNRKDVGPAGEGQRNQRKYGDLVALRFFEESNTLIVSGLVPCDLVRDVSEIHPPQALDNLYGAWQKWCAGRTTYQGFFTEFPLANIISSRHLTVPGTSARQISSATG